MANEYSANDVRGYTINCQNCIYIVLIVDIDFIAIWFEIKSSDYSIVCIILVIFC